MRIAVIGGGISGLGAAWLLSQKHDVTLYEAGMTLGGHANTVQVPGHPAIDTGFIVYNDWTYPNLIKLFEHLKVTTTTSDMSFGVSMNNGAYEYSSNALFSQFGNIAKISHFRMLADIARFSRETRRMTNTPDVSLSAYLEKENYSRAFIHNHIYPMAAAIWSSDPAEIGAFPLRSFLQFFKNHGLLILDVNKRPQWRTVKGGSRQYVDALQTQIRGQIHTDYPVRRVERKDQNYCVMTDQGEFEFEHIIFATHTDKTVELCSAVSDEQRQMLSGIPYKDNIAYLHQDKSLMPKRRKSWASWNFMQENENASTYLTYWMNQLQPEIGKEKDYFVSLNPPYEPQMTLYRTTYAHPKYGPDALKTWQSLQKTNGQNKIWFCGAWCGYGFHEDGLASGLAVAEAIDPACKRPWDVTDKSPAAQHCKPHK